MSLDMHDLYIKKSDQMESLLTIADNLCDFVV